MGLTTLSKVVDLDISAVQRHRAVIVECLRDTDFRCNASLPALPLPTHLSIRKRALYLIYALVDASNARTLVRELLSFLAVIDPTLRAQLTAKLCFVAEKSPLPLSFPSPPLTPLPLSFPLHSYHQVCPLCSLVYRYPSPCSLFGWRLRAR